MKLLKYVMTADTGLAPNPFFGVCSLAVCTPNHRNAKLCPGDWILGHTSRSTENRLVYVMRLTAVLDMPTYFVSFPQKRPKVGGRPEERCGDNLYDYSQGRWIRVPSVLHNNPDAFRQDQNRKVYVAEGNESFWYFGGSHPSSLVLEFADRFPGLIKDRQGYSYVYDESVIRTFVDWLSKQSAPGRRGNPRDFVRESDDRYLVQIEPTEEWVSHEEIQSGHVSLARASPIKSRRTIRRGCS